MNLIRTISGYLIEQDILESLVAVLEEDSEHLYYIDSLPLIQANVTKTNQPFLIEEYEIIGKAERLYIFKNCNKPVEAKTPEEKDIEYTQTTKRFNIE